MNDGVLIVDICMVRAVINGTVYNFSTQYNVCHYIIVNGVGYGSIHYDESNGMICGRINSDIPCSSQICHISCLDSLDFNIQFEII